MPELPEVETMAADLRPELIGRVIRRVRVSSAHLSHPTDAAAFAAAVRSSAIEGIRRRGKRLIFDLRDADATPRALLIEVRMTGEFHLLPSLARPHKHDRLALTLDDGRELRLRDTRGFCRIGAFERDVNDRLRDADGADPLARMGPEPLLVPAAALTGRLAGRRSAIKPLLLDQSVLAGVGNIYADEALWRAGIHPLARPDQLTDAQLVAVTGSIQEVLTEAVARRGSSVRTYRSLGERGSMQEHLNAYGRAGQPCRRCGATMTTLRVGGRGTTVCPRCQTAPTTFSDGEAA